MQTANIDRDLGCAGGAATIMNSTRAGYLPVPLEHVPAEAFEGVSVYLRVGSDRPGAGGQGMFVQYLDEGTSFTESTRQELLSNGVALAYIHMADQYRFREQAEVQMVKLASDPKTAISAKASLIYETGLELVNELLSDPDVARLSHRVQRVARATATVVLNDPRAFSHLFTASHHDFYTATHMINVATYMVPLAYELGIRGMDQLTAICEAGLLHDIGKMYVPEEVLNKVGRLSDDEWTLIRRHPELGAQHLSAYEGAASVVMATALQHHERLDGSGYPGGLRAGEIDRVAQMCAVVDGFDAMTALRPFKKRALSIEDALRILESEAPEKLDQEIVETWARLVRTREVAEAVESATSSLASSGAVNPKERREHQRYEFNCPARIHVLEDDGEERSERGATQVVAHSISAGGLGVLSRSPIEIGTRVHVYLLARTWNDEYIEAAIVRCQAYRDGWYEMGLSFLGRGARDDGGVLPAAILGV